MSQKNQESCSCTIGKLEHQLKQHETIIAQLVQMLAAQNRLVSKLSRQQNELLADQQKRHVPLHFPTH